VKKILLAYVPVLHEGYRQLFVRDSLITEFYLFGEGLIQKFGPLRKDIRALPPHFVRQAIESWGIFKEVVIADENTLKLLNQEQAIVTMPDEEECREIAKMFLANCAVEFDGRVFLRWDRPTALAEQNVRADRTVPFSGLVAELMGRAFREAELATNLWRRVGAVIARGKEVLLVAHNTQVPSHHTPYYEGDPRMFFKRGLHIELTTDDHAERRLIAEAARRGVSIEDSDCYVTTFPCPPCGKQIAYTGIRTLYFAEGYAMLDSERILRENSVELVRVEMKTPGS